MKKGAVFLMILISIGVVAVIVSLHSVQAVLPTCIEGGYMDALDCRYDSYSCSYASQRSGYCMWSTNACMSLGCSAANYNVLACKTMCSIDNGQETCYNCSFNAGTGMCIQGQQCQPVGKSFCLPGLRKCSDDNTARTVCNALEGSAVWVVEEDCSKTKNLGVCAMSYGDVPGTACVACDGDGDGYIPAGATQFGCSDCTTGVQGGNCDCDDYNAKVNPGATENCTNGIDDNCDGLVDKADKTTCATVCSDSDGGFNIYTKGTVNDVDGYIATDLCTTSGQLTEYSCNSKGLYNATTLSCPSNYRCQDGACVLSFNCTKEGEYLSAIGIPESGCCPGLKIFKINSTEQASCCGMLGAVIGTRAALSLLDIWDGIIRLFKPSLVTTSETQKLLCYNATNGIPTCKFVGTSTEGWYYNNTGKLLRYEKCGVELTCSDLCPLTVTCSDCGYSKSAGMTTITAAKLAPMNMSDAGMDLIRKYECFKSKVYVCPAGKLTIGYGHVLLKGEKFPKGITKPEAEI
jgi:hypothetical protein